MLQFCTWAFFRVQAPNSGKTRIKDHRDALDSLDVYLSVHPSKRPRGWHRVTHQSLSDPMGQSDLMGFILYNWILERSRKQRWHSFVSRTLRKDDRGKSLVRCPSNWASFKINLVSATKPRRWTSVIARCSCLAVNLPYIWSRRIFADPSPV